MHLKEGKGYKVELREMKWNGVEGNEMASSGASGNQKEMLISFPEMLSEMQGSGRE